MGASESKIVHESTQHHPNLFDRFPKELTDLITSLLEVKDLVHFSCSCKKFRSEILIESIPFQESYFLYGDYADEMKKIASSKVFDRVVLFTDLLVTNIFSLIILTII